MTPAWAVLDDHDRGVFRAAVAFLKNRLADAETINWALRLKSTDRIQRIAIEDLLDNPGGGVLEEPWATTWRLIEESWFASNGDDRSPTAIYDVWERLQAGDRSGSLIAAIVHLVAPQLKVEPIPSWQWQLVKKPRRPRSVDDLISTSLSSGDLVDLNVLEIGSLTDIPFLKALAIALEGAINHGLEIGRRIGWDGHRRLWMLGDLGRVYYVEPAAGRGEGDPDSYHHGIAPAVKLLYAVVSRIADLEPTTASQFIQRWRLIDTPIHFRLWAAAARSPHLVSDNDIAIVLLGLDDRKFWDLDEFPELSELRAKRFGDFNPSVRQTIIARLRKGPPRNFWPRRAEAEKVRSSRLFWTVRELRRIDCCGGKLPPGARSWLADQIKHFPELEGMHIDEGFPGGTMVRSVSINPDDRYDTLEGATRLRALETGLSSGRGGWEEDPAERAREWLRQPDKIALVLRDLNATGNGGAGFPTIWSHFGWAHSPRIPRNTETSQRDLQAETDQVLFLLSQLTQSTLLAAVEGISHWLDSWKKEVVGSTMGLDVWLRIWPIAVDATNATPEPEDDVDLSVTARSTDPDREPMDLDTLNTPAGKLVGVFLAACPSLRQVPSPFAEGSVLRQMRDTLIAAEGRSGLIVRHRLIEALPYFLEADQDWSREYLVAPLLNHDGASLALWRAIARRTHFTKVLKIIGGTMAERATDQRLGRETRRKLVFSLVVESLHAFRESRDPAVPNSRVLQMLRTLDDEVRAHAANTVQQFVSELSGRSPESQAIASPADIFRSSAAPFLEQVWPQERSLASASVSRAFSDLPATSGNAFAEAVDAIERFLVPFDCWSMVDYGMYGREGEAKKLAAINDETKARAFLRLLDLTIGTSEGAVIPRDLTDALDQIRSIAPPLADTPTYRRLATAARR